MSFDPYFDSWENYNLQNASGDKKKPLYLIDRPMPSKLYLDACRYAYSEIRAMILKHPNDAYGVKAGFTWPSFENIVFGFKNQVFAVIVDMVGYEGRQSYLSERMRMNLQRNSCANNLVPCLFKVHVDVKKGEVKGMCGDGWNLFHAISEEKVDVEGLGGDEPIEMSDWELQECAIQVVMDYGIRKEGKYKISSYSNAPEVDPQIWMVDKYGNMKWVMVRHAMYPERRAKVPDNMGSLAKSLDSGGFFASVAFCAAGLSGTPCRHEGVIPYFTGLEEVK